MAVVLDEYCRRYMSRTLLMKILRVIAVLAILSVFGIVLFAISGDDIRWMIGRRFNLIVPPGFSFASEIPSFTVGIKDRGKLNGWLKRILYYNKDNLAEFALPGEYIDEPRGHATPRRVVVKFTTQVQKTEYTYGRDKRVISSIDATYDPADDTLNIFIQSDLSEVSREDWARVTEINVIDTIFTLSNYAPVKMAVQRRTEYENLFKNYITNQKRFSGFLEINPKVKRILGLIVKPVYAGCTGDYECGFYVARCSNGDACTPGSTNQCPNFEVCPPKTCEGAGIKSCTTKSYAICDSGSGACAGQECVPAGTYGCSWVCVPICNAPNCGQANGCGGTCSSSDVGAYGACSVSCGGGTQTDPCGNTQACNTWSCCDPNAWGACDNSCGGGSQTNECGDTQGCCGGGSTVSGYGAYSSCSGSPATKSRTVTHCCTGNTSESANCTGSIQARAMVVSTADTSCTAVKNSAIGAGGTVHRFSAGSASQPAAQTQSGTSYVTFAGIVGGSYTLIPTPPINDVLVRACWAKSLNTPLLGEGTSTTLSVPTDADTITWNVGYTYGTPWVQTQGGDVAASGTITSLVPVPQLFTLDGTGGYPGIVSYGSDYDFDQGSLGKGETLVSSKNWLVKEAPAATDYYQLFFRRFGAPQTNDNALFVNLAAVARPTSRPTPYYIVGDVTTSGNWSVGAGEKVMFLVNGNLTINGTINITGTGFVAFIVSGNITVSPSVGVAYNSSIPVLEGVYITSPTGTFSTGTSSVPGSERFVGKGTFIAGNFLLQRDLDALGQNPNYAGELFIYNPQFLITMPDQMRNVPITWPACNA